MLGHKDTSFLTFYGNCGIKYRTNLLICAIFVIDIRLRCDLLPDIRAQLIIWLRRDMHCNENDFLR
jgi:hypothetical protein